MSVLLKSRLITLLMTFSFLLASAGVAAAQSSSLSIAEKAKVHLILSHTKTDNIRAMGGGGYGYADPATDPYGHFSSDISPWIMMGARRSDSPNPKNRIKAYVADLESGVIAAHDIWPTLSEADIAAAGTPDLPRIWSELLEDEKSKDILDLVGGDTDVTEKTLKKPLKALRKSLQKLY